MQYRDLCTQMSAAGWLSHLVAGCNADHRPGSGKKHFFARELLKTRTGSSFASGRKVPFFNRANALPASVQFHDEHGWHTCAVLLDRSADLLAASEYGRWLVAYLSDIPADRITTAPPAAAPPEPALSAVEGKRLFRLHRRREREPGLARAKRRQILSQTGRLACEACDNDYQRTYGPAAARVFEVHHLSPLGELDDQDAETETTLDQLALVCANCHRVLHRTRPPVEVTALRAILGR